MQMLPFSLHPFAGKEETQAWSLTGGVSATANVLNLTYRLAGWGYRLAEPVGGPQRRDRLWETTCFEFFLGWVGSAAYWEFNLSPSGDWNVYRFQDYRAGMESEERFLAIPVAVRVMEGQGLELSLSLDLSPILERSGDSSEGCSGDSSGDGSGDSSDALLQLGITSVIEAEDGTLSYWALIHPGPEADFHRRDSFVLTL